MPTNIDFTARIDRLEREARVWRAAAVLAVLLAAAAWLVPAASAQSQVMRVDTIFARRIYVEPHPFAAPSEGGISLIVDENGASVLVNGSPRSRVALFGPGAPQSQTLVSASVDDQSASVWAYDASHASASMGFAPDVPGAFRAYDSADNPVPVWTAP
jgi:hypothetical protein